MAIPTLGVDIDVILANEPSRASFFAEEQTLTFQSQWTGLEQRVRRFYRWRARMEWTLLSRAQAYAVLRYFNRYNMGEAFRIYDPVRQDPSGDVTATVLSTEVGGTGIKVNGGGQTGRTLNVRDIPNRGSSVKLLGAGDLLTFKDTGQMVEVFADVLGTSGTTGTIELSQYIRTPPADGELIFVQYAPVKMRLAQSVVPDVQDGPAQFGFAVDLVEAIA
jgi:hypothetical protein